MNNSTWVQLHSQSAEQMITGDLDGNGQDEVIVDLGTAIWVWMNNSNWVLLHSVSAKKMIAGDLDANGLDDLIIDFDHPHDTWVWMNNYNWKPFSASADNMEIGDLDSSGKADVIMDFGDTYGLWVLMNHSGWVHLHNLSAKSMVTGNIDGGVPPLGVTDTAFNSLKLPSELENTASFPKAD